MWCYGHTSPDTQMSTGKAGLYFIPSDILIREFLHNYIHLTKFSPIRGSRVTLLKPTALHWIYSGSQAPGKPLQQPGLHSNSTTPEEILAVCLTVTGVRSARWFSMAWTFAEMQGTDSRRKGGRRHFIKMLFSHCKSSKRVKTWQTPTDHRCLGSNTELKG